MIIKLASPIQTDSIVDGSGIRTVIWTQGCRHNCEGCHNPLTHSFSGGFETTTEHIIEILSSLQLQKGITFSGGDPFEQALACYEIAKAAHKLNLDVWSYTGYTVEQLVWENRDDWNSFLSEIDFLVDGPFILSKRTLSEAFIGSSNQRIINMKEYFENKNKTIAN